MSHNREIDGPRIRGNVVARGGVSIGMLLVVIVVIAIGLAVPRGQSVDGGASVHDTVPSGGNDLGAAENIDQATAVTLARDRAPADGVLSSVELGTLQSVIENDPDAARQAPPTGEDASRSVWAVKFKSEFTICPPDGSPCWSPRPGETTVIIDAKTGDFVQSYAYSP